MNGQFVLPRTPKQSEILSLLRTIDCEFRRIIIKCNHDYAIKYNLMAFKTDISGLVKLSQDAYKAVGDLYNKPIEAKPEGVSDIFYNLLKHYKFLKQSCGHSTTQFNAATTHNNLEYLWGNLKILGQFLLGFSQFQQLNTQVTNLLPESYSDDYIQRFGNSFGYGYDDDYY
jgi:hypothetical protein